ncbi:MAG TPA: hypothetical protein VJP77_06715 [Planctomycetota bacterium]|nr:hypothetical protein [Planctomycetota bacterium]
MSTLLLTALLAGAAWPRQSSGDEAVRAEIEFARGLATRWQFVDLASRVLDDVAARGLEGELQVQVELARCQVLSEGARFESDPAKRQTLYQQALDGYRGFIERFGGSEQSDEAKRAYVNLGATYATVMIDVLAQSTSDDAERLREELTPRLTEVVGYTSEQIAALQSVPVDELPPADQRQLSRLQLSRGQLLLALARVSEDPEYFLSEAEATIEDLVFQGGIATGESLIGYLVLGDVYTVRGDHADAAEMYAFVVDSTIPSDPTEWSEKKAELELAPADVDSLWYYVELATQKTIEAFAAADDRERSLFYALHFVNTWASEGLALRPYGYLSMLAVAGALLDAGGYVGGSLVEGNLAWFESPEAAKEAGYSARDTRSALELALTLAGRVNEDNPKSALQVRAQRLISDAVGQPGVRVSADVLYEAALGDFNSQQYEAALDSLRRVQRGLEDDAQKQALLPKVLHHVGRSLYSLDRHLEAAFAFREGVTTWRGDEQYDGLNAQGFYSSMQRVRRDATGDPQIEALWRESEVLQSTVNIGTSGDILYRQGIAELEAGQPAAAREILLTVPPDAFSYEPAKVKAAVCLFELGRYPEAEKELRDYLEGFVGDPRNKLSGGDTNRLQKRDEACAEGEYYLGRVALDQGQWAEAIARLRGFPDRFGGQPGLCAAALAHCLEASLELGDVEGAKAFHARMVRDYPQDAFTGQGASKIYNRLIELYKSAEGAGDAEEQRRVLRQLAEYARIANQLASEPTFAALRQESVHWMELGEWAEAESVLERLAELGAQSPRNARDVEKFVLPDLGYALLRQLRPQDAFDVLGPLVPNLDDPEDKRKPALETVATWCKSVTGILEGDPANPTVLPGVGGAESFATAQRWWDKIADSQEKWVSKEWYESKFQLAWTQYQWSAEDSAKKDSARRTLNTLRAETTNFRDIEQHAGPDVRRRYEWLWDQVK